MNGLYWFWLMGLWIFFCRYWFNNISVMDFKARVCLGVVYQFSVKITYDMILNRIIIGSQTTHLNYVNVKIHFQFM